MATGDSGAGDSEVRADLAEVLRRAVLSYDYTVLAGTQGTMGHRKKDRLLDIIERLRLPTVFFTEGGGARPDDTDHAIVAGLDTMAFALWARLSGVAPRIGVASGRCFAGNAVLLGMCDIVIATPEASIGMGGPAMIEGGGLGVVAPDDVGPVEVRPGEASTPTCSRLRGPARNSGPWASRVRSSSRCERSRRPSRIPPRKRRRSTRWSLLRTREARRSTPRRSSRSMM